MDTSVEGVLPEAWPQMVSESSSAPPAPPGQVPKADTRVGWVVARTKSVQAAPDSKLKKLGIHVPELFETPKFRTNVHEISAAGRSILINDQASWLASRLKKRPKECSIIELFPALDSPKHWCENLKFRAKVSESWEFAKVYGFRDTVHPGDESRHRHAMAPPKELIGNFQFGIANDCLYYMSPDELVDLLQPWAAQKTFYLTAIVHQLPVEDGDYMVESYSLVGGPKHIEGRALVVAGEVHYRASEGPDGVYISPAANRWWTQYTALGARTREGAAYQLSVHPHRSFFYQTMYVISIRKLGRGQAPVVQAIEPVRPELVLQHWVAVHAVRPILLARTRLEPTQVPSQEAYRRTVTSTLLKTLEDHPVILEKHWPRIFEATTRHVEEMVAVPLPVAGVSVARQAAIQSLAVEYEGLGMGQGLAQFASRITVGAQRSDRIGAIATFFSAATEAVGGLCVAIKGQAGLSVMPKLALPKWLRRWFHKARAAFYYQVEVKARMLLHSFGGRAHEKLFASVASTVIVSALVLFEEYIKRRGFFGNPLIDGLLFGALEGSQIPGSELEVLGSIVVRGVAHALLAAMPFWAAVPLHLMFNMLCTGTGSFRWFRDHIARLFFGGRVSFMDDIELEAVQDMHVADSRRAPLENNGFTFYQAGEPLMDPYLVQDLLEADAVPGKSELVPLFKSSIPLLAKPTTTLSSLLRMGEHRFAPPVLKPVPGYWDGMGVPSFLQHETFSIMSPDDTEEYLMSRPWPLSHRRMRIQQFYDDFYGVASSMKPSISMKVDEKNPVSSTLDGIEVKTRPLQPLTSDGAAAFAFERNAKGMLKQGFTVECGGVIGYVLYMGDPGAIKLDVAAGLFEDYAFVIFLQGDDFYAYSGGRCFALDLSKCDRHCGEDYQAWLRRVLTALCVDKDWMAAFLKRRRELNTTPPRFESKLMKAIGVHVEKSEQPDETATGEVITSLAAVFGWFAHIDQASRMVRDFSLEALLLALRETLQNAGFTYTLEERQGNPIMPFQAGTFLGGAFTHAADGQVVWVPLSTLKTLYVPVGVFPGTLRERFSQWCHVLCQSEHARTPLREVFAAIVADYPCDTDLAFERWAAYQKQTRSEEFAMRLSNGEPVQLGWDSYQSLVELHLTNHEATSHLVDAAGQLFAKLKCIASGLVPEFDGSFVMDADFSVLYALRFHEMPVGYPETPNFIGEFVGEASDFDAMCLVSKIFSFMTKTKAAKARARAAKAKQTKTPPQQSSQGKGKRWYVGASTSWGSFGAGSGDAPPAPKSTRSARRTAGGGLTGTIHREESLGSVTTSAGFATKAYPINPGLEDVFPWASQLARNFSRYRLHNLRFEYRPLASVFATAGQQGRIVLSMDPDVYSGVLQNISQAENMQPSVAGVPSEARTLRIPEQFCAPTDAKLVRSGAVPANTTAQVYDVGKLYFSTSGMANDGVACGELWVIYDLELMNPNTVPEDGTEAVSTHSSVFTVNGATAPPVNTSGSFAAFPNFVKLADDWDGLGVQLNGDGAFTLLRGKYRVRVSCGVSCPTGTMSQFYLTCFKAGVQVPNGTSRSFNAVNGHWSDEAEFYLSVTTATEFEVQYACSATAAVNWSTNRWPRLMIESV